MHDAKSTGFFVQLLSGLPAQVPLDQEGVRTQEIIHAHTRPNGLRHRIRNQRMLHAVNEREARP